MASEGPLTHTASSQDAGNGGTEVWADLANCASSDNAYTTASLAATEFSYRLKLDTYGFTTIPDSATVDGIEVAIEKSVGAGTGTVWDTEIYLLLDGVLQTTNKAASSDWPTSDTVSTYGSPTDPWGETWTGADIKAGTGIGVAIAAYEIGELNSRVARIDLVTITVHYTGGGSSSSAPGDPLTHLAIFDPYLIPKAWF
jgi:hypothetical protein